MFAAERTQEILEDIARLKRDGEIGAVPVFPDSPLAGWTTEVFRRHRRALERGTDGTVFTGGDFRLIETVEQSKAIGRIHGGAVILAGSGMCDAGREPLDVGQGPPAPKEHASRRYGRREMLMGRTAILNSDAHPKAVHELARVLAA